MLIAINYMEDCCSTHKQTNLSVERKVGDVDGTGATEDGGRNPQHGAVAVDYSQCVTMLLQPRVRATTSA